MERFYSGHDGTRGFYRVDMNEGLVKADGLFDLGDQLKNMGFNFNLCADFDRDGRLDILCTARNESDRQILAVIFNEGNGRWTVKPIPQALEFSMDLVLYDVDGNGYIDIVENYWKRKRVLRNLGNREFAELEDLDGYLLKMDIDQDGLADLQLSDDGWSIIVSNHGSPVQVPSNFTV